MESNWETIKQKKTEQLEKELQVFVGKLEKIRSNRISLEAIWGLMVNCQGGRKPLKTIANLRISPNHELIVRVFEPKMIPLIKKTILENRSEYRLIEKSTDSELYFALTLMTKEIRDKLIREVKLVANEGNIALRKVRESFRKEIKKEKSFSQDQVRKYEKSIDELTKNYEDKLTLLTEKKIKELSS